MEYTLNTAEWHFQQILKQLGEDVTREGLQETPKRYIKFMKEFLEAKEFNFTTFENEGTDQMIIQTNIPFYSLCEHHTAPFFGTANVAYIPHSKIVGLSKLARCVDLYANKFQNQERITTQIAERLNKELNPKGVAVSLKSQHLCMCMRGVKKHDTWTVTSKLLGVFKEDEKARNEFLNFL
jgi:GTP cyclohydrolase I